MTVRFQRQNEGTVPEAYRIFFEVLKEDNIDAMVKAAWEFFGLPILLTDENYKSICQYPPKKAGTTNLGCTFGKHCLTARCDPNLQ